MARRSRAIQSYSNGLSSLTPVFSKSFGVPSDDREILHQSGGGNQFVYWVFGIWHPQATPELSDVVIDRDDVHRIILQYCPYPRFEHRSLRSIASMPYCFGPTP